jgi:hypothetical protein
MQLCRSHAAGAAKDIFLAVDGVNPMTIAVNITALRTNFTIDI